MIEITQADRDAAAEAFFCKPLRNEKHNNDRRVQAFARHRMAERAKIVDYARGHGGNAWSRDVLYFADKVEAGDHLK